MKRSIDWYNWNDLSLTDHAYPVRDCILYAARKKRTNLGEPVCMTAVVCDAIACHNGLRNNNAHWTEVRDAVVHVCFVKVKNAKGSWCIVHLFMENNQRCISAYAVERGYESIVHDMFY